MTIRRFFHQLLRYLMVPYYMWRIFTEHRDYGRFWDGGKFEPYIDIFGNLKKNFFESQLISQLRYGTVSEIQSLINKTILKYKANYSAKAVLWLMIHRYKDLKPDDFDSKLNGYERVIESLLRFMTAEGEKMPKKEDIIHAVFMILKDITDPVIKQHFYECIKLLHKYKVININELIAKFPANVQVKSVQELMKFREIYQALVIWDEQTNTHLMLNKEGSYILRLVELSNPLNNIVYQQVLEFCTRAPDRSDNIASAIRDKIKVSRSLEATSYLEFIQGCVMLPCLSRLIEQFAEFAMDDSFRKEVYDIIAGQRFLDINKDQNRALLAEIVFKACQDPKKYYILLEILNTYKECFDTKYFDCKKLEEVAYVKAARTLMEFSIPATKVHHIRNAIWNALSNLKVDEEPDAYELLTSMKDESRPYNFSYTGVNNVLSWFVKLSNSYQNRLLFEYVKNNRGGDISNDIESVGVVIQLKYMRFRNLFKSYTDQNEKSTFEGRYDDYFRIHIHRELCFQSFTYQNLLYAQFLDKMTHDDVKRFDLKGIYREFKVEGIKTLATMSMVCKGFNNNADVETGFGLLPNDIVFAIKNSIIQNTILWIQRKAYISIEYLENYKSSLSEDYSTAQTILAKYRQQALEGSGIEYTNQFYQYNNGRNDFLYNLGSLYILIHEAEIKKECEAAKG